MSKIRKRPTYFEATCLNDGTILCAMPARKPAARLLKRDKRRIDVDNIIEMWRTAGKEYRSDDERRFRFFDIITNSLNTRRNLRDLVLPMLVDLQRKLETIDAAIARLEQRGRG